MAALHRSWNAKSQNQPTDRRADSQTDPTTDWLAEEQTNKCLLMAT